MRSSSPYRVMQLAPAGDEPTELCLRLQAEIEVRREAALLWVYGDADGYTRPRWRRILDTALDSAATSGHLVIDLSETVFIGCQPILDLAERAQQGLTLGVELVICTPVPAIVDRVATVTGLDAWLPVHTGLATSLPARVPVGPAPVRAVVPAPGAR